MSTDNRNQAVADFTDSAAISDTRIGQIIGGKYRILEKIGAGGMGSVYKAEHTMLGRPVALKVLHRNLSENEEYIERFRREAYVASQLDHPNAITLFDFGLEESSPYIVMHFVEGRTLKQVLLEEGALSIERTVKIFQQVGGALAEAHRLQIVHRDLKPDNIMLSRRSDGTEWACILDFGIAKPLVGNQSDVALTRVGMFMGTPQYMSPEQALDQACDARSDLYSLGIIVYEMLAGQVPFTSTSPVEMLYKHINDIPIPVRQFRPEMDIPVGVSDVVAKSLSKKPEDRFQTVTEFLSAFDQAIRNSQNSLEPWARPKATANDGSDKAKWIAGVAVLLLAGLAAYLTLPQDGHEQVGSTEVAPNRIGATSNPSELELNSAFPPTEEPVSVQPLIAATTPPLESSQSASTETTPLNASQNNPLGSELGPTLDTPSDSELSTAALSTAQSLTTAVEEAEITVGDEYRDFTVAYLEQNRDARESNSDSERLYQAGQKLLDEKQYLEAAQQLQAALIKRSSHLGARLSLGVALLRLNQPQLALEHFEVAHKQNPEYPPTIYNIASYHAYRGNTTEAIKYLEKAIALYPKIRTWPANDPEFDGIRSDPAFIDFISTPVD